ncbi:MAG: hypothetical protein N3D84_02410 [Candidatus Woesearchaeota archaeon]|nr:hypothetical protein [Candidatus Woesearchaeota archaeon]
MNNGKMIKTEYSDDDLRKIVSYFREKVKARSIKEFEDIFRFPNDILMSYAIEGERLSRINLAYLFNRRIDLEHLLKQYEPKKMPPSKLPKLLDCMDYNMPPSVISSSIRNRTKKFCIGADKEIIAADCEKKDYKYPSDKTIEYYLLTNEASANIPIFDFAFLYKGRIYVRENSLSTMLALNDAKKYNAVLYHQYANQMKDFENYALGIILAHEICEAEIIKNMEKDGKNIERSNELELKVEENARKFLEEQGISLKYYWLFHRLRAYSDEVRVKNISSLVIEKHQKTIDKIIK